MRILRNAVLLGLGVALGAVITTHAGPRQQGPAAQPLCTLPGKIRYSPGAQIKYENQTYRCYFVNGDEMAPGVAWVKVESTWIPKEPSAGR